MRLLLPILFLFLAIFADAQPKPDGDFIENLLKRYPAYFKMLLDKRDSFNVQVIYTQIDRDKRNRPSFKEYTFNLKNDQYFYPASTVKMPVALLALEKLNELKIKGLDMNSTMITDSSFSMHDVVYTDPTAVDSRPTLEQYIKQIFLVSDNNAFNRLYEFLGQEYIQKKLTAKGYPDAIIRHRLNSFRSLEENRNTNPVQFYDTSGVLLYDQSPQYSHAVFPVFTAKLGKAHYNGEQLVDGPFEFSLKNRIYLQDLHHILRSLLFPESARRSQRFNLTKKDQDFVWHWMSAFPRESRYPYYDTSGYWDAYCKFILYGSGKGVKPSGIRIFNKVGDAYGFLTDISYVVDFDHHIEFMLSATISCNSDGIYNDDQYDYETIGFPFLQHLGQVVYDHELGRKRKHVPDLSRFAIKY